MARLGAWVEGGDTHFALRSPHASAVDLCLFDADGAESRVAMVCEGEVWRTSLPQDLRGRAYGYRAQGAWAPESGLWFDPAKLLVDPYAVELDRRFQWDEALRTYGADTAHLVPRALVPAPMKALPLQPPRFTQGGLIYEVNVRGFTLLHPEVPPVLRGTVAALAHPAIIAHLRKLKVSAVELMPIVAWIDERHLPPLGLRNFWGYNPVCMMVLDPGLCPGGVAELRDTVAALHEAGVGVILDMVFNHSGESDIYGPVLSLRGLNNSAYAHDGEGRLINDTGCGNTLDFANPHVRALTLASLRHFVAHCGVDGFRFDLAPVLARGPGFDADAPIFAEMARDPWLADRVMIAEPWDIGPGGYQLGRFPAGWLEWNDRYRDDMRRFWRGEGRLGDWATRMAGSADIFGEQACRSVNFLAAHDGFTLADTVAYENRHNLANGEDNRDGHGENFSWNHGVEGPSEDPAVVAARARDLRAMLACLFASTGTIMLTAGDEFGRSQQGNNNAYCQDSPIGWIDWQARDAELEDYVAALSAGRVERLAHFAQFPLDGQWQRLDGAPMQASDWDGEGLIFRAGAYGFGVDRSSRHAWIE
ncbi:glycogen debranching enzyme GlgX [Novosphingobium umbonatum]|uniref:Glycogen debranching enzyme GlgX n=1 Tax=Novosphingobium umbonatum TaxID=1908524 RepID=A0A3S2V741_9SPHN|nr:glycogen debranching protein GlgX [Novosphingobium umbonatum]RVU05310.1 glycogen debranching enzyme GlgX [Novosphingobium umbonatum]